MWDLDHKEGCCSYSVTQSCPTLFDPMNCSTPGFPVFHYLLEFAQTHVHWIADAIQPSHPLSYPSPPAFPSIRVFFHWVGSLHKVAKEGWAPKNWCFWTVVLEKTLENPLDGKEIKPVTPKGNQPYSLEGVMLKVKLQYFGHLIFYYEASQVMFTPIKVWEPLIWWLGIQTLNSLCLNVTSFM